MRKTKWAAGDRFRVSGDSADLWLRDYNVRVDTGGMVVVTPEPNAKKIVVTLDEIDGELNSTVLIRRSRLVPEQEEPLIHVGNLILEVTRRCNMACEHCLRGDAQDLDMPESVIDSLLYQIGSIAEVTFTGGEPSLNIPIIRYFFKQAKRRGIQLDSFYVVTNGKDPVRQKALAHLLLDAYQDMSSPEYCGVAISFDQFHDRDEQTNIMKGLAFYRDDKNRDGDNKYDWIISSGRASENGIGRPPIAPPSGYSINPEAGGHMHIDQIYVAANGNLYYDCDQDYDTIDDDADGHVENMTEYFSHILNKELGYIRQYTVYQLDDRDPSVHNLIFRGLAAMKSAGYDSPPSDKYVRVYQGEIDCDPDDKTEDLLERIFTTLNLDKKPDGYAGRSLSMSDIVAIENEDGDTKFFYCQSVGFAPVEFDPEKVSKNKLF